MNVGVFQRFTATPEQQAAWEEWLTGARAARLSGDICHQGFLAGWRARHATEISEGKVERAASALYAFAMRADAGLPPWSRANPYIASKYRVQARAALVAAANEAAS
jgi:hypothetical protein